MEHSKVGWSGGASAEIKTGERRLIEFFLSPFTRHAREALRER